MRPGLNLARTMVQGGMAHAVMVVGFEKMERGSLGSHWNDRENPGATTAMMNHELRGTSKGPNAPQLFGNAGREYMEKYVFFFFCSVSLLHPFRCAALRCALDAILKASLQVRRHERGLCRDSTGQPRAQPQQPVLSVPRRVHARANHEVADDSRAADQSAMLPDI